MIVCCRCVNSHMLFTMSAVPFTLLWLAAQPLSMWRRPLVLCVLQLERNSSKTSSKYLHFPRVQTMVPIDCYCAGQCAAKRQRTGKDAGTSGKRHAGNENVCCTFPSHEASVTTCSYVKELEATVAWLKGPDYKPGAAAALRLSVQSGSFPTFFYRGRAPY